MATLLEPNLIRTGPPVSVSAGVLKFLRVASILLAISAIMGTIIVTRVAVYFTRFPMTWTASEPVVRGE